MYNEWFNVACHKVKFDIVFYLMTLILNAHQLELLCITVKFENKIKPTQKSRFLSLILKNRFSFEGL